jgi:hypothetical protein
MKKLFTLLCLAVGISQSAAAGDLAALGTLTGPEFKLLSEDLGSALSYKPVAPAEALGITGFDIGIEVTSTDISRSKAVLSKAGSGASVVDSLLIPKLHVSKGLPFGIDVAASWASIPGISANLVGAELRYALIDGGVAMPALALRGAMTNLNGSNELSFSTRSLDISVSKGFLMFTPYAGVGQVWVNSTRNVGTPINETFTQGKFFAGANINMGLLNFALEFDKTGDAASTSLKMGLRW